LIAIYFNKGRKETLDAQCEVINKRNRETRNRELEMSETSPSTDSSGAELTNQLKQRISADAQLCLSDTELFDLVERSELEHDAEIKERAAMWSRQSLREKRSKDARYRIAQMSSSFQDLTG
jgi:hypothetical protein